MNTWFTEFELYGLEGWTFPETETAWLWFFFFKAHKNTIALA
jgi:hypothetical protein